MTEPTIQTFLQSCEQALGAAVVVREPQQLETHSVDFWRSVRGTTPAVLRPTSTAEVARIVALAAQHRVGLVPQGGNTGLVGGNVPDQSGALVVLSLARLNRVRALDGPGEYLIAEAGCTLASVQEAAHGAGRLFPLSLGSEGTCQIGGNLSTNAGGVNVLRYGMARDLVLGLEVVTADGRVWDGLRPLRKDNTGYDLKQLFIGAEGSLGIITAAVLRLFAEPRERATLFLAIPSPAVAVDLLARTKERFGELVTSFELIGGFCVDAACEHLPGIRFPLGERAPWYVLAEVAWSLTDGLGDAVDAFLIDLAEQELVLDGTRAQSDAQRAMLWRMREGISEALHGSGSIARNDVSVPIARIPQLLERAQALLEERFKDARLVPFGHVGDGNLHLNVLLPGDAADHMDVRLTLQHAILDVVEELGGSISAEHGIGRLKRSELHARRSPLEIGLMRTLKQAFDPLDILNPGVIV